jgi:hypothetical protein
MSFLRWLFFMPALMLVSAVMQAIWGNIGELVPWWISIPMYFLFFGAPLTMFCMYRTAFICPNLKIGGWMFFGLFIITEPLALFSGFSERSAAENIIRIANDLAILYGIFAAAIQQSAYPSQCSFFKGAPSRLYG